MFVQSIGDTCANTRHLVQRACHKKKGSRWVSFARVISYTSYHTTGVCYNPELFDWKLLRAKAQHDKKSLLLGICRISVGGIFCREAVFESRVWRHKCYHVPDKKCDVKLISHRCAGAVLLEIHPDSTRTHDEPDQTGGSFQALRQKGHRVHRFTGLQVHHAFIRILSEVLLPYSAFKGQMRMVGK